MRVVIVLLCEKNIVMPMTVIKRLGGEFNDLCIKWSIYFGVVAVAFEIIRGFLLVLFRKPLRDCLTFVVYLCHVVCLLAVHLVRSANET